MNATGALRTQKMTHGGYWPNEAPSLPDLEAEVFAFPNARHDDQVDSISQALAYEMPEFIWNKKSLAGLARFNAALGGW
jgi:phage terminase large subunit-like protein